MARIYAFFAVHCMLKQFMFPRLCLENAAAGEKQLYKGTQRRQGIGGVLKLGLLETFAWEKVSPTFYSIDLQVRIIFERFNAVTEKNSLRS